MPEEPAAAFEITGGPVNRTLTLMLALIPSLPRDHFSPDYMNTCSKYEVGPYSCFREAAVNACAHCPTMHKVRKATGTSRTT